MEYESFRFNSLYPEYPKTRMEIMMNDINHHVENMEVSTKASSPKSTSSFKLNVMVSSCKNHGENESVSYPWPDIDTDIGCCSLRLVMLPSTAVG